jgi:hypothetical protein
MVRLRPFVPGGPDFGRTTNGFGRIVIGVPVLDTRTMSRTRALKGYIPTRTGRGLEGAGDAPPQSGNTVHAAQAAIEDDTVRMLAQFAFERGCFVRNSSLIA